MTAPFIQQMLEERGLKVSDCDAVCLSMGPGSYTGLRVGSSTAKGLCFGAGIPLLAVGTLDVLVAQALEKGLPEGCRYIFPMIDARRMEVYTAPYDASGKRLGEVAPTVVSESSFSRELSEGRVLFIGDGAAKCEPVLCSADGCGDAADCSGRHGGLRCSDAAAGDGLQGGRRDGNSEVGSSLQGTFGAPGCGDADERFQERFSERCCGNAVFRQEYPEAASMLKPALEAFSAGAFRDTAYFEPFYLKDFIATVAKNPLLR